MDKPTYRRGLQAVKRRGELVAELLQDHGYSIRQRGKGVCVSCAVLVSVVAHVIIPGALAICCGSVCFVGGWMEGRPGWK